MECNFFGIIFKAEGWSSDTWNFVQFHSTELVYNQVIMGDWA